MKKVLLTAVTILSLTGSSQGETGVELLQQLSGARTLEVTFHQQTKLPVAGDEVTLYKGVIYYKRPLKFLWEYTYGSKLKIVSNGKEVETVFDDGSCQKEPLNPGSALFPLLLVAENFKLFKEFYEVKSVEKRGNETAVKVVPKFKDSFFKQVSFVFKKNRLTRVKTVQFNGVEATYFVDGLKKNLSLPDSLFKLPPCK